MNLKKIQDAAVARELEELVWSDSDRCGGVVCFKGTRVFVSILFDFIDSGSTTEDFYKTYDWISPNKVERVLELREIIEQRYENLIR